MSGRDRQDRLAVRTARNAAALASAEVAGKVATLAYSVVAVRVLSQEAYGAFAYALMLALMVQILPEWGFNTILVQQASADRRRLAPMSADVLFTKAVVGVITFGVTGVVAARSRPSTEATIALGMVLLAVLLDSFGKVLQSVAAVVQRQTGIALTLVVQRFMTAVLAIAALLAGQGVVGLAAAYLAGSVVGNILEALVVRRLGVPPRFRRTRWADVVGLFRGSTLIGVGAVLAMLLFRVDAVIIEAILGDAAVARYAVAYHVMETVLFLSWSLTYAVFPVISQRTDPERVRAAMEQSAAILAFVYVPFVVVTVLEAPAVIGLVFGSQYLDDSPDALRWLSMSPLLFGVASLLSRALVACGRHAPLVVSNGVATLLNIALNIVLIPTLGIVGAAMVTSVSLMVKLGILLWSSWREFGVPRFHRSVLEAVLACVPVAAILGVMGAHLLVEVAVSGVAYLVVWLASSRRWAPERVQVIRELLHRRPFMEVS